MCPYDVAWLGGRYSAMAILERWGAPWRKPWQMVASNNDLGGLQRLWCINLTLFSFCCSMVGKIDGLARDFTHTGAE
jgi:hypothetical protein